MAKLAASAIYIIFDNKLLLFQRDDIPEIPYPGTWDLVGGMQEQDETPEQALRREIKEEVTYVPRNINYLGKW